MIFYEIHSHTIFAQILNFFRENNVLIALRVKHNLEKSNFDQFGASLRKFHIFGVKVDTLDYINHLKCLRRLAQKDFYICLKCANFTPKFHGYIKFDLKDFNSNH